MPASLSSFLLPSTRPGQLRHTLAGVLSSPWILYALFFSPLGLLGAHHAWLGHWRRALAYLITFGLWGGGWLYDLLHFQELAKEQHEQQEKAAGRAGGAMSPCSVLAAWAKKVETKQAGGKHNHKPTGSLPAARPRHAAPTSSATTSSAWSSPVPPVAAASAALSHQPTHHTALTDNFPLPPPPAPSHTHHKRKSDADADDSDRPNPSVRVRSAEIDDREEAARLAHEKEREREHVRQGSVERERQRQEAEERLMHREEANLETKHEQPAPVQQLAHDGEQSSNRHELLKQAMLQQHNTELGTVDANISKPAQGVVYLQTLAPSSRPPTVAPTTTTTTILTPQPTTTTYSNTAPTAIPHKPIEPVTVIRPTATDGSAAEAGDGGVSGRSGSAPIVERVVGATVPAAVGGGVVAGVVEGEEESDFGQQGGGDEQQQRNGGHGSSGGSSSGGKGGQQQGGNGGGGGGRRRGNRGKR